METRANHVWVGVVTLALLAAAAVFFVWLARLGETNRQEFDIFFEQSVGGVAEGSVVTYSGVPVGQVSDISIWERDPEFVKVRIRLESNVPIHVGTEASVSASFTGVSNISLGGGQSEQPLISCATTTCLEDEVPVIPPAPGAIGEILASTPLLLQRLATLTDRLTRVLDDDNQNSIAGILRNTDAISGELARTTPEVEATLNELQATLNQSTETLAAFEQTLLTVNTTVERDGSALTADLQQTLLSAREAAGALEASLGTIEPLTQQLSRETLPAASATMEDLRVTSETLRNLTERLETQGAGSLLSSPPLPDYEP